MAFSGSQRVLGRRPFRFHRRVTATERDLNAVLSPADLNARYREVRAATEALAAPLSPEDQVVQSMPDVSPTKWHRAHTTWFFETFLLEPDLPGYTPCDPAYGYLFNSYYEAVGDRYPRPQRGLLSRPTVEQVADYRSYVDRAMDDLFARVDERIWPRIATLVELGCNHEQQHQELLLMDIKHVLSCNPLDPSYLPPASGVHIEPSHLHAHAAGSFVEFDGGLVEIGHPGPESGFAFDNETPRHTVLVAPFRDRGPARDRA